MPRERETETRGAAHMIQHQGATIETSAITHTLDVGHPEVLHSLAVEDYYHLTSSAFLNPSQ